MDVIKTVSAGAPGTKKYLRKFGDRLVCVRYRKEKNSNRRFTTVELIVDENTVFPNLFRRQPHPSKIVSLRIGFDEYELRQKIKQQGAKWSPEQKTWKLAWQDVVSLGLEDRVIE